MNIIQHIDNFNIINLFFLDKKRNIVMNGSFTKIMYSVRDVSFLGMFFDFPIDGSIMGSKYYNFNIHENIETITRIINIEKQILDYYKTINEIDKNSVYVLKNNISQGHLKVYTKKEMKNKKYVLKISGVWETTNEIGITYKLLECIHL